MSASRIGNSWITLARSTPLTPGQSRERVSKWAGADAIIIQAKRHNNNNNTRRHHQAGSSSEQSAGPPGASPRRQTTKTSMNLIKKAELIQAGARLSQILEAIWP